MNDITGEKSEKNIIARLEVVMFHVERDDNQGLSSREIKEHGNIEDNIDVLSTQNEPADDDADPMKNPENSPSTKSYEEEWSRRSAQRFMRLLQGGVLSEQQQSFDRIGAELHQIRREHGLSLQQLSKSINVSPQLLCFYESGWMIQEEFVEVIDHWADALGLCASKYKESVPSIEENSDE